MARIRTVKPEFWTDEKLAECSLPARLLFIGLWNFADDEGRMEYSPKRVKMQVFPGDNNIHVARLIEELARVHLIQLYSVEGRDHLAVPNFRKHQKINRPNRSRLPAPDGELSPEIELPHQESPTDEHRPAVQQVWDHYIATIGRNPKLYSLTEKRIRMGKARVADLLPRVAEPKLENTVALMKLCVDRLAASAFHNGQNDQRKKYLDWEILFRSTDQMEKWLDDSRFGGRGQ